jgi:hypothetical protein
MTHMLRLHGRAHKKSDDPVTATTRLEVYDRAPVMSDRLPEPRLTKVYRLEATLAEPLDLGDIPEGHRRIVPLTGGTFTGPEISGKLLAGASADWQIVQSRRVRHGSAEVLARLAHGEAVDASEYTFRTATHIETAAPDLDWFNKGIFISVGGRQPGGVIYETYLVA